jgi:hypothetical protein
MGGFFVSGLLSTALVGVAIALSDISPFIEKIEQGPPDSLGSLSAIFAHIYDWPPVPRPENRKKNEAG